MKNSSAWGMIRLREIHLLGTASSKSMLKKFPAALELRIEKRMAKIKGKATVTAKIKENRLHITLQGIIPKKEAENLYTDIRFCVSDLQPGFTVITDLTQCRIGHLQAINTARKIVQFLVEKKVGPVVRIVGQAKVIYLQMLNLSDKAQGYEPIYVPTLEEAEAFLYKLAQKELVDEIGEHPPPKTEDPDNAGLHANPERSAESA